MTLRERIGVWSLTACMGMFSAFTAFASSSENYGLEHFVVNAVGSTASANRCLLYSGGEVVIGQTYGNSCSAQIGFLNEYFRPVPTRTVTPTITPTFAVTPTLSVLLSSFKVFQSRINPLKNEEASIRWSQPASGPVTLTVYNLLGDKIVMLLDHMNYPQGRYHTVTWDERNQAGKIVGSGIYIVHIKTESFESRSKVAVIK